jgi:hypothetical protein
LEQKYKLIVYRPSYYWYDDDYPSQSEYKESEFFSEIVDKETLELRYLTFHEENERRPGYEEYQIEFFLLGGSDLDRLNLEIELQEKVETHLEKVRKQIEEEARQEVLRFQERQIEKEIFDLKRVARHLRSSEKGQRLFTEFISSQLQSKDGNLFLDNDLIGVKG